MQLQKSIITPSRGDVHVNRPLTNISIAYMQEQSSFVASSMFPNVPVSKISDQYFVFPLGEFSRDEMRQRAPGTESAGSGYAISSDNYSCRVFALHKDVHDQIRANEDSPLNGDTEATQFLTMQAMMNRERRWIDTYFKTGVWTLSADGAGSASASQDFSNNADNNLVYWNNTASNPIENVRAAKTAILERTGFEPNKLLLGKHVYDVLVDHPDIIGRLDRGQTTGPAMTNMQQLAALFEVDQILVSKAIYNSSRVDTTASHSFVAGKHALLAYSPASPGLMTPSCGYTFSWTGFLGAGDAGMRMKRFRMENLESDRIEIQSAYDFKVVSEELGFFFNGIVE